MSAPVKKDEPPLELESQLILRLPEHVADEARTLITAGAQSLKDKINIDIRSDGRNAIVRVNHEDFAAKLVDLPCILETHKTFDKKTLWKTADVSQMLVCTKDPLPLDDGNTTPQRRLPNEKVDKKYVWNHGITPPLKNVRKRRFRKSAKKKYIEAPDIEEEVKRLLRMDSTAFKTRWEVLADEDAKDDNRPGSSMAGDDLHQMFADVSSSEDECQDVSVDVEDEGTRDSMDMSGPQDTSMPLEDADTVQQEAESEVMEQGGDEEESQEQSVLTQRYSQLKKELEELGIRERNLKQSLGTLENMNLKQRFITQLDQVMEEARQKQKEFETLEAIVGDG